MPLSPTSFPMGVFAATAATASPPPVSAPPLIPWSSEPPPHDPNDSPEVSADKWWANVGGLLSQRFSLAEMKMIKPALIRLFGSGYYWNLRQTPDPEARINQMDDPNTLLRASLHDAPLMWPLGMSRTVAYHVIITFLDTMGLDQLCTWIEDYLVNPSEPRYLHIVTEIRNAGEVTGDNRTEIMTLVMNGAVEGAENLKQGHLACGLIQLARNGQAGLDRLNSILDPPSRPITSPSLVPTWSHPFGVPTSQLPTDTEADKMWGEQKRELREADNAMRPGDPRRVLMTHCPPHSQPVDQFHCDAANATGGQHVNTEMMMVYLRAAIQALRRDGVWREGVNCMIVGMTSPDQAGLGRAEAVRRELEDPACFKGNLFCSIQRPDEPAPDDLWFCCTVMASADMIPKGVRCHVVLYTGDGNDAPAPCKIWEVAVMLLKRGHLVTIQSSNIIRLNTWYLAELAELYPNQLRFSIVSRS